MIGGGGMFGLAEIGGICLQRGRYRGIYMREKYLCKNLSVKEGGGHLFEGGVVSETCGTTY